MHPKYPDFLKKVADEYQPDHVVHIGDLVDWNSISYHPKSPSLANPDAEFKKAKRQVKKLYEVFPDCDWLIGNHDALPRRRSLDALLPNACLVEENYLWGVDNWEVYPRFHDLVLDNVIYRHGDKGKGGQRNASFLNAQQEHMSVVQGHHHSQAGVEYMTNLQHRIFGMQVGSGTQNNHPNLAYSRIYSKKGVLGCGTVTDGKVAQFIPMP